MKILITIDFPPENGGIQKYLLERVLHIYKSTDIVLSGSSRYFAAKLPCKLFQCTTLSIFNKKLNLIPICFILFVLLIKNKACVIEAGNIYGAIPAFLLSLVFKHCRYSVICHGMELLQLQRKSLKSSFLKAVLDRSFENLVVSKFTLNLLKKAGISNTYSFAPPKIDLSKYERRHCQLGNESFNILSVGRFVHHKGHSTLLEAAAMLPQTCKYNLTIAGDGPLYNHLIDKCCGKFLTSSVEIKRNPSHQELMLLYREADLFIFPSLHLTDGVEGFGIVLLEAMAFRIPVIASDTGGIPEVVTHECAVLIPPGDPAALCKSIIMLYENPMKRIELAQKAFERVEKNFSWDHLHENSIS